MRNCKNCFGALLKIGEELIIASIVFEMSACQQRATISKNKSLVLWE